MVNDQLAMINYQCEIKNNFKDGFNC